MRIETVKIAAGDSYIVINKCDFDSKVHTLFGQKKAEKKPTKKTVKKDD